MPTFKNHEIVGHKEDVSALIKAMANPPKWVEPADELSIELDAVKERLAELDATWAPSLEDMVDAYSLTEGRKDDAVRGALECLSETPPDIAGAIQYLTYSYNR